MTEQTDRLKKEVEIERFCQIYSIEDVKKAISTVTEDKNLAEKIVDFLEYEKFQGK